MASYKAHIRHSVTLKALQIQYFPAWCLGLRLRYETYSFYIAPCDDDGLQTGGTKCYQSNQEH